MAETTTALVSADTVRILPAEPNRLALYEARVAASRARLRMAVRQLREAARELTPAARIGAHPIRYVAGGLALGLVLGLWTGSRRR